MTETTDTPEANTPAPDPNIPEQERSLGMLCHLIALAGFAIPFGGIVGPLVVWLVAKEGKPFVDEQGKEALNFNITVGIAGLICFVLMIVVIGFFLLALLAIVWLVFIVIASIKTYQGEHYRYPVTFRFIN